MAISDLATLLAGMRPVLDPAVYVFATVPAPVDPAVAADALMTFRESEGLTLVLAEERAVAHGLAGDFPCRRITLTVHSALDAVGFLAAILPRLAAAGMGVNPVSAYHHDHLFVPAERAEEAFAILREIAG